MFDNQLARQDFRGVGGEVRVRGDELRRDFAGGLRFGINFFHPIRAVVGREDDLLHGVRGLLGFAEFHPNPRANLLVERGALQTFAVAVGIHAAGNFQVQRRPGVKSLHQRIQFLRVVSRQRRAARREILPAQFLAAAAEQRAEQRERRRGHLDENVFDGAPDHFGDAKIRLAQIAVNRHVQNNFSVAVLQNGDAEAHRQMRGVRAVHLFAKRELVQRDDVFRIQFFPDEFIREVEIQFALGDAVAGELARIRAGRRQIHVLHGNLDGRSSACR